MIPPVRELLSAYAFLSRRFAWEVAPSDEELIEAFVDARLEAERLALGSGDEVAALFYACAARSPSIGEDFVVAAILVTLNHGSRSGRRVTAGDERFSRDLVIKSRETAARARSYDAFRAWLSARFPETAP